MKLNKNYLYNFEGSDDGLEELTAANRCAIVCNNMSKRPVKTDAQKTKAFARAERNAEEKAYTQGRNAQRRYKR